MDRLVVWANDVWNPLGVAAIAIPFMIFAAWRYKKASQTSRTVAGFAFVGVVIVGLVLKFADPLQRWGCVLAFLPAVMIFQHAVFLRLVRMPFRPKGPPGAHPVEDHTDHKKAFEQMSTVYNSLPAVFSAARKNSERYFSPSTLAVRYGAPAVAVAIVGLVVFYLLFVDLEAIPVANVGPAKLGAAGAYVYVLLYLGQRNFRHDVTSGGAMWCAVMLAVGPVLACAISHFANGGLPPSGNESTSVEVLYFAAGLAPRHVAAFLEETVRRVWVSPSSTTTATPRTIPITQVRGVTTGIAERLAEEGIDDLYGLASADPLRLIRNTNFDKRQIISWIDEAILVSVLPDHWQALEKEGFTGAIDLTSMGKVPEELKLLSERLKFDNVAILQGVVRRLCNDAQLKLVLVLYLQIDQLDAQDEIESTVLAANAAALSAG